MIGSIVNQKGIAICWGYKPEWETLPIVNLPADAIKVRRRIRKNEAMQVFVQTPNEITWYVVGPTDGKMVGAKSLMLLYRYGVNVK